VKGDGARAKGAPALAGLFVPELERGNARKPEQGNERKREIRPPGCI